MLSHGLNTLQFDGTPDAEKHFLRFQISTPDQRLSLSISEAIRGDTQTQVDTLNQVFNDLSDVMSSDSTEENKDQIYANLMISVKTLMFDQHIVNKKLLDEFTILFFLKSLMLTGVICRKMRKREPLKYTNISVISMCLVIWVILQTKL